MNRRRTPRPSEPLRRLLTAYDEALAAGSVPTALPGPPGEEALCGGLRGLLDRLDRVRPRAELAATAFALPGGPTRVGRFRIERELGRGGYGIVYLAFDAQLRREVALKIPRLEALLDESDRRRFLREGRAAAVMHHPNLIPVYEAGEVNGLCYLVSAFCDGPTLATWLNAQTAPVAPRTAARLVLALADAVQYMHEQGILHRDIKPSNVLLEPAAGEAGESTWLPRLTDFGLAKDLLETSESAGTRSDALIGTPQYMAPEQAEGRVREIGPHTDIYALGLLLYELLVGRPPFLGETPLETVRQIAVHEPLRPRRLRPGLPRDVETICLKCLEKNSSRRYSSAADLAGDLRRFLDGEAIQARPVLRWERAWRWTRHRFGVAGLAALSMAALVALAGTWVWHLQVIERAEQGRRRLEYARRLPDAQRAWEAGDAGTALELLNALRPAPGQADLRGFEWHYLWRQLKDKGLQIACRQDRIWCTAYAPDGRTVATGAGDGTVKLWDAATGQMRLALKAQAAAVHRLAFSPEGGILASGGDDLPIVLWDPATGRQLMTLEGHRRGLAGLAFSPDGRFLVCGDNEESFILWDMPGGRLRVRGDRGGFRIAGFTPDSQTMIAGGIPLIHSYDVATGRPRGGWATPEAPDSRFVALSPAGNLLATRSAIGTTYVRDLASGTVLGQLPEPAGRCWPVEGLAFSPDGRTLAVGCSSFDRNKNHGHVVRLWQFAQNETASAIYEQSRGGFGGLSFSPDGRTLAVGSGTGELCLWRPIPGPAPAPMSHAPEEAWCVAFSPDGTLLVSGGDNEKDKNCLRLWDAQTGRLHWAIPAHEALITRVGFSPDGTLIATGCFDGSVKLWDATGRELALLPGHSSVVQSLTFSPDGRTLATGDRQGLVHLWNVAARRLLRTLAGNGEVVYGLAFRPDGRQLFTSSGDHDRAVRIWNVATGRLEEAYQEHHAVCSLACSPDGRRLALGGKDGRVQLWDLTSGDKRLLLADNQAEVRAVAFMPDGHTLASAGADRVIRLWEPASGYQLLTLSGHHAPIHSIAFSPDGTILGSASHDGEIKLWNAGRE